MEGKKQQTDRRTLQLIDIIVLGSFSEKPEHRLQLTYPRILNLDVPIGSQHILCTPPGRLTYHMPSAGLGLELGGVHNKVVILP